MAKAAWAISCSSLKDLKSRKGLPIELYIFQPKIFMDLDALVEKIREAVFVLP